MSDERFESWGRFPKAAPSRVVPVYWRSEVPFVRGAPPFLARGNGRSYGDSCLNGGGTLLTVRTLDRFIALDQERGLLTCEAGATLGEILDLVAPRGLFLPVVPGTQHVTVGGAIANDVHGKNHHRAGNFGAHVESLELLRSDGVRRTCSLAENPELFAATVGGLGLTGLILSATLRLRQLGPGVPQVRAATVALRGLDDFFSRAEEADAAHEFTVAWIDCLATGARLGRGLFTLGDWAAEGLPGARPRRRRLSVPVDLPVSPLNRLTVTAFNRLYYAGGRMASGQRLKHYESFFFPLDHVAHWNRIYGRDGPLQFQCALPRPAAPSAVRQLLGMVARHGEASFLAVLKTLGEVESPGMLSFPRQGVTLALDFANRGERTTRLFRELHETVAVHGGRLYPAKDAHMSGEHFRRQYAEVLPRFRAQVDPAFSSSFWRRVEG
ncbi:MAG TPA: FAD-binding oxidoreductase [Anaeromyxobacter sp.]|nr:FAD-binding oxidoreductase [Anaeromyxobacter sp.]